MAKQERAGETDGRTFRVEADDVSPGTVLRMVSPSDGSAAPFSDYVITSAYWTGPDGVRLREAELTGRGHRHTWTAELARPYLYATSVSTASPSALTGVETMKVDVASLLKEGSLFRVVCTARGNVHTYVK